MKVLLRITAIFLTLSLLGFPVNAQNNEARQELKRIGFDIKYLNDQIEDDSFPYSFDITTTSMSADTITSIKKGRFDAVAEKHNHWILESVNDRVPTKTDNKLFYKSHKKHTDGLVDFNTLKILENNNDYLVIEFLYDKASISRKNSYLEDCTGQFYINKQSKKLEKVTLKNNKEIKASIIHIEELDMLVTFEYLKEIDIYAPLKQQINIKANLFGISVSTTEITTNSNYTKKR